MDRCLFTVAGLLKGDLKALTTLLFCFCFVFVLFTTAGSGCVCQILVYGSPPPASRLIETNKKRKSVFL